MIKIILHWCLDGHIDEMEQNKESQNKPIHVSLFCTKLQSEINGQRIKK